jgi:hypothetical protein
MASLVEDKCLLHADEEHHPIMWYCRPPCPCRLLSSNRPLWPDSPSAPVLAQWMRKCPGYAEIFNSSVPNMLVVNVFPNKDFIDISHCLLLKSGLIILRQE